MCVYGSRFTISSCALVDMNYNAKVVPGCTPYLVGSPADHPGPEWCWVFKTDDLVFGVELGNPDSVDQRLVVRRVDMYWRIDNLTTFNLVNPWAPSVTVTLYSPQFSSWRLSPEDKNNMIPQEAMAWRNLRLQRFVSTSTMNYWSTIYFAPSRYRAIRPRDALSILGLNSTFVDIDTLHTSQHDWPLNFANVNYTKHGNYQGEFSFMLTAGDMEVRTEQRQHTVLAALALAGGCYGVIFAVYCVLFGTPKLTPFGFTHGMSIWYHRGKNKLGRKKTNSTRPPPDLFQSIPLTADTSSRPYLAQLESRVHELESVLREYFLDVDYLDEFRARRRQEYMETATDDLSPHLHHDVLLEHTLSRKPITGKN
ncbi:hypothetical protein BC941DRAFT_422706 [Chlamydoabsidia padenii]|nr:hypothetical protein BC941DRAFT_422706 [Chlamydoabsidia padenii]